MKDNLQKKVQRELRHKTRVEYYHDMRMAGVGQVVALETLWWELAQWREQRTVAAHGPGHLDALQDVMEEVEMRYEAAARKLGEAAEREFVINMGEGARVGVVYDDEANEVGFIE